MASRAASSPGLTFPVHPQPQDGELLSSWMVRLAHSHGLKTQTFYAHWFGRNAVVWNRDLDRCASAALVDRLARACAFPVEKVEALTLRSLNGRVFESCEKSASVPGLLSLGAYHRKWQRGALQYCPQCLAEDRVPYMRKRWRMAWATVCTVHRCKLQDRCPECGAPIQVHRVDIGQRRKLPKDASLVQCGDCKRDIRRAEAAPCHDDGLIEFQRRAEFAMANGYVDIGGMPSLHSLAFFQGLRVISAGVESERRAQRGVEGRREELELLDHQARHALMREVAPLILGWPDSFIAACNRMSQPYSRMTRSLPRGTAKELPFWVSEVLTTQVKRDARAPTPDEQAYMRYATEQAKGRFTLKGAQELFGRRLERQCEQEAVSAEDAETLIASIDREVSGSRGKERSDHLRDKVLLGLARGYGLPITKVASLTVREADLLSRLPTTSWTTDPAEPEEVDWMSWYLEEVRSQYPAKHSLWLFLCGGRDGRMSESLVSARFQSALRVAGLDRRINGFRHWILAKRSIGSEGDTVGIATV